MSRPTQHTQADLATRRREEEKKKEEGFAEFLKSPPVKMLISLVPPTQPPEVLETLLRAAFMDGCSVGNSIQADTFMQMVVLPIMRSSQEDDE